MLETVAADEQLIIGSNEDILIQHSGVFFTERKFIQHVLFFLDKLWRVSFDGSVSIWTSAAIIPPIVSSSEFGAATRCQASFFLFFLYFISHDFPSLAAPVTSFLSVEGLWIKSRLSSRQYCNQSSSLWISSNRFPVWRLFCRMMFLFQFLLAVLQKMDSSTCNQIYQGWQLLMQSLKTLCNSITKRLAPGRSPFRD